MGWACKSINANVARLLAWFPEAHVRAKIVDHKRITIIPGVS